MDRQAALLHVQVQLRALEARGVVYPDLKATVYRLPRVALIDLLNLIKTLRS